MELIKPFTQEIAQEPGTEGMYKMIDRIAGTCYNRTGLHKDSEKFVMDLIDRNHLSPLEFGTVYLKMPEIIDENVKSKDLFRKYSEFRRIEEPDGSSTLYITTNYRYIIESGLEQIMDRFICEPTEHHIKRHCFYFRCSRGIADELARHRTLSVMMKSTRYVKMDNLEIIHPYWLPKSYTTEVLNESCLEGNNNSATRWWNHMRHCENTYKQLLENGLKPQEARGVLPMDMRTDLYLCGTYNAAWNENWDRFLALRAKGIAGDPHPDAQKLALMIQELLRGKPDEQNEKIPPFIQHFDPNC